MIINAEEARNIAKANSSYNSVMAGIYKAIDTASHKGEFHAVVTPGHEFKYTCIKELELHGFKVEDVKQGIYPTGKIEIKW